MLFPGRKGERADKIRVCIGSVEAVQHSPEHALLSSRMFLVQPPLQLFCIFPFGMSVSRAGAFADRKAVFIPKADDIRLVHI